MVTGEQVVHWARLYLEGLTRREIAVESGVSHETVRQHLRGNVKSTARCQSIKIVRQTREIMQDKFEHWSEWLLKVEPEERRRIRRSYRAGSATMRELAERHRMAVSAIHTIVHEEGSKYD